MKKALCLLLCACALPSTAVQNSAISAQDIVGEWNCKIIYQDLGIQTLDNFDFRADGSLVSIGLISVQQKFIYESRHSGSWTLQGDILSDVGTDYSIIPLHSKQMEQRLKAEPKLRYWEQRFLQSLRDSANAEVADFKIVKFQPERMEIRHIWPDKQQFPGLCERKKS